MKYFLLNLKLKLIIGLVTCCSAEAQVTWPSNTSTNMNTDYVGWASTVTNPLRIKHEGNYGIEFYTNTGAGTFGTPKMELESTGQLGIGTTTPASWLHVVTTGSGGGIEEEPFRTVVPSGAMTNWRMFRGTTPMLRLWHGMSGNSIFMHSLQGHLNFASGDGTNTYPFLQLKGGSSSDAGNVLIGNYSGATPFASSALLHVKGKPQYDIVKFEHDGIYGPAYRLTHDEQHFFKSNVFPGSSIEGTFDFNYSPSTNISHTEAMKLTFLGDASLSATGLLIKHKNTSTNSNTQTFGINCISEAATNQNVAIRGETFGSNTWNIAGEFESVQSNTGSNWGLTIGASSAPSCTGMSLQASSTLASATTITGIDAASYGGTNTTGIKVRTYDVSQVSTVIAVDCSTSIVNSGTTAFGIRASAPIQTCVTIPGSPPTSTCSGAAGYFLGDVYTSSLYYELSDLNFKRNIVDVQDAGSILKQINGKQYTYDNNGHDGFHVASDTHYGFISQEVELVLPNVVKEFQNPADVDSAGNIINPAFTSKAIHYTEFIPLLVEAYKDQAEKIDSLILALNSTPSQKLKSDLESASQRVELKDITSIILQQNDPNPFTESTRITFTIPEEVKEAKMIFTNNNGSVINSVDVQERGTGELQVFASDLSSGIYTYTLVCDGKVIDSRKMMKK